MKFTLRIFLSLFLAVSSYSSLEAQRLSFRDSVPASIESNYLSLGIGLGGMTVRDLNLSPLFYDGINPSVHLSYQWYKSKWYHDFLLQLEYGALMGRGPKMSEPNTVAMTHVIGFPFSTTHLWKSPWIPSEKWDFDLGGAFKSSSYIRLNPSLFNNVFSMHYFMNLMATGKVTFDMTRTNSYFKTKKNGKEKLKTARQRKLSFQMDFGLLNMNYMPGFTNTYMPSLSNELQESASSVFKEYNFRLNGWRFDARLEFMSLLSTGNGHKIALSWSAMHAKGVYQPLDFGTTQLHYTLMINQKR